MGVVSARPTTRPAVPAATRDDTSDRAMPRRRVVQAILAPLLSIAAMAGVEQEHVASADSPYVAPAAGVAQGSSAGLPLAVDVSLTGAAAASDPLVFMDEDSGANLVWVVVRDRGTGRPIVFEHRTTLDFELVECPTCRHSATRGVDFEAQSGTFTFQPGESVSEPQTVVIIDDELVEPDESFIVDLSNLQPPLTNAVVNDAEIGIADNDDDPIALDIGDASGTEDAGDLVFDVRLTRESDVEVVVTYGTADLAGPDAAHAGVDYREVMGTLRFAPGETLASIRVPVLDDQLDEPDETFAVLLSDAVNAMLEDPDATGTIVDDDELPVVSIIDVSGAENIGEMPFTVELDHAYPVDVTVAYATEDLLGICCLAEAGHDYERVTGILTFAPGDTVRTIQVPILDDDLDEPDEAFGITLADPVNAMLDDQHAKGTIRDDDDAAASVADAAGPEDADALAFPVTLDRAGAFEITLAYSTADGTAQSNADYRSASGTVTFAPGELGTTILVSIIDDSVDEADETFTLLLSSPINVILADAEATGTIEDDDEPPQVVEPLPDAMLCMGGDAYRVDLGHHFTGDVTTYRAMVSDPTVATVAVDGVILVIAPMSEGSAIVTVTAANQVGETTVTIPVTVVADAAELAAIDGTLAAIGRNLLGEVATAVGERFDAVSAGRSRLDRVPPGPPLAASGFGGTKRLPDGGGQHGFGLSPSESPVWLGRTPQPANFAFTAGGVGNQSDLGVSVWARGGERRFEGGTSGGSHDGSLSTVGAGMDIRTADWIVGAALARNTAQADYNYLRSESACGQGGIGEGALEMELRSVHPYAGRRVGEGWVWGTVGTGRGDASVTRCASGQRSDADLSMRLVALGGRHPLRMRDRFALTLVEDVGILRLKTGESTGPIGGRNVSAGRARLGLEGSGVAPPDCRCWLSTYARALVRGDWGDGDTGAGLEFAGGVRFRNPNRRIGIDAGARAVAVHSAKDYREYGVDLAVMLLPRPDGTGLRWTVLSKRGRLRDTPGQWLDEWQWQGGPNERDRVARRSSMRFGYGFERAGGAVVPFVEAENDVGDRHGYRLGLRYSLGDSVRWLALEFAVGRTSSLGYAANAIGLIGEARF